MAEAGSMRKRGCGKRSAKKTRLVAAELAQRTENKLESGNSRVLGHECSLEDEDGGRKKERSMERDQGEAKNLKTSC